MRLARRATTASGRGAVLWLCAVGGILAGTPEWTFAQTPADPAASRWEEDYAWALTRRNGSPEAYQWFLERYPDSRFSNFAFREIIEAVVSQDFDGQPAAQRRATEIAGAASRGDEMPF